MGLKAWIEESGGVSVGLLWRSLVYMDEEEEITVYTLQGCEMKGFFLFFLFEFQLGCFRGFILVV